ncbi:MAG: hypothetical protein LBD75_07200 [Candidatus Peribacteria bacterium]|jgi:hypothetical protein|nr:hypothetical protein [Candidatus Peribacteria bacterium]
MTDQSIPATNGQPVTPPTEPMKKTFFGGEVAFDDPTAFKAVDAPQLSEQSPIEETEEKVEEQEMNRSEVVETEQGEEI